MDGDFLKRLISILYFAFFLFSIVVPSYASGGEKYVVLGDSIAKGTGTENPEECCFGKTVADRFGWELVNYGVDGYTSSDLLALLDRQDVSSSIRQADYISISIGGNNYLKNNVSSLIAQGFAGKSEESEKIVSAFAVDFAGIISAIRSLNPDAVIIVQTLYNPRHDSTRSIVNKAVKRLNETFYNYLDEHPGEYVIADVYSAIGDDSSLIAPDTIHPNEQGHRVIADEIISVISSGSAPAKDGNYTVPLIISVMVICAAAFFIIRKRK